MRLAGEEPVVQLHGVTKGYQSLRPLRLEHLELFDGQSVALVGFDAAMAEVLVNLITGASVPDTGQVIAFGEVTTEIADSAAWLKILDRFGLVSDRAVLIEQLTAEQSLVMPLSLELDNMSPDLRDAARGLADEVGLSAEERSRPVGQLTPSARLRVRLGRALALDPRVLLAEHPNASLSSVEVPVLAADLARIVARRRIASIVITADRAFATAVAEQVFTLQPATGALKPSAGWRRWFS
jgi:predicted ABC-type transport system involved in lysophospholipase L1 biosynthesis ATPase subunit